MYLPETMDSHGNEHVNLAERLRKWTSLYFGIDNSRLQNRKEQVSQDGEWPTNHDYLR
jgi:hypothetical protein